MKHDVDGDTNCGWSTWNNPKQTCNASGWLENNIVRDHPDYNIIRIDQDTEKIPGDLKRLAVIKTTVKNQLKKCWCEELSKEYDDKNNNFCNW